MLPLVTIAITLSPLHRAELQHEQLQLLQQQLQQSQLRRKMMMQQLQQEQPVPSAVWPTSPVHHASQAAAAAVACCCGGTCHPPGNTAGWCSTRIGDQLARIQV
ncbi:hypothetical protein V8C86DRAFT_1735642 [Haematococcus lacustris]